MSRLYQYSFFFFFNDTATTEIYTLSLHDALPISRRELAQGIGPQQLGGAPCGGGDGVERRDPRGDEQRQLVVQRRAWDEQLVRGVRTRGDQAAGALELPHELVLPGPRAAEGREIGAAPARPPAQA